MKGQLSLGDMGPAAMILVVAIVIVAVGAYIVSTVGSLLPANSSGANVAALGATALTTFASWFVILAVIIAAGIGLGILLRSFMGGGRRGE